MSPDTLHHLAQPHPPIKNWPPVSHTTLREVIIYCICHPPACWDVSQCIAMPVHNIRPPPSNVFDGTAEYVRRSLISTYGGIHCHPHASYNTPMYRSFTRMALYCHSLSSRVHIVHNTYHYHHFAQPHPRSTFNHHLPPCECTRPVLSPPRMLI